MLLLKSAPIIECSLLGAIASILAPDCSRAYSIIPAILTGPVIIIVLALIVHIGVDIFPVISIVIGCIDGDSYPGLALALAFSGLSSPRGGGQLLLLVTGTDCYNLGPFVTIVVILSVANVIVGVNNDYWV